MTNRKSVASSSRGRVSPSSSSSSPGSRRITRSMTKPQKTKSRLLPVRDASLSNSISLLPHGEKIRDVLNRGHEKVSRRIGSSIIPIDMSTIKVIHLPRLRHTVHTHTLELAELGVIFASGNDPFSKLTEEEMQEYARSRTIAAVFDMVAANTNLPQEDLLNLMSLNRMLYNTLISNFNLWLSLDLHEKDGAGDRLVTALSMTRYYNVENINLSNAKDIADEHFKLVITEGEALGYLQSLCLDGCQNISNTGVKHVTSACPRLQNFSIGGNLRVTDFCIKSLVKNCKGLINLCLKDCKNITDNSLATIGKNCHLLESLDIARCEQVTDVGVADIAGGCPGLKLVSLYGIPRVTRRRVQSLFGPSTQILSEEGMLRKD